MELIEYIQLDKLRIKIIFISIIAGAICLGCIFLIDKMTDSYYGIYYYKLPNSEVNATLLINTDNTVNFISDLGKSNNSLLPNRIINNYILVNRFLNLYYLVDSEGDDGTYHFLLFDDNGVKLMNSDNVSAFDAFFTDKYVYYKAVK